MEESLRRHENWKKGLPVMDMQAYEYDRIHEAKDRIKPFRYNEFGEKFYIGKYCTAQGMPNREELQMDNFKLQEENIRLRKQIEQLKAPFKFPPLKTFRK